MVNLTVNGTNRPFDGDGDDDMPLLWYLRDDLRLTGLAGDFDEAFRHVGAAAKAMLVTRPPRNGAYRAASASRVTTTRSRTSRPRARSTTARWCPPPRS